MKKNILALAVIFGVASYLYAQSFQIIWRQVYIDENTSDNNNSYKYRIQCDNGSRFDFNYDRMTSEYMTNHRYFPDVRWTDVNESGNAICAE